MVNHLKPLVVILALAALTFWLARPLALRYMSAEAYARRRNVWLALTVAGFVSPSFWYYVLFATPLLLWLASRDDNPAAVLLMLAHVIPPANIELPSVIVNRFFELNNFRLLALAVLLPAMLKLLQQPRDPAVRASLRVPDAFVLAYFGLQLVLLLPYESITNTMRRGFLYSLDALLIYFVVSRVCLQRRALVEALATWVLACALMAVIAVFEQQKGWLLYIGVNEMWGDPNIFAWLLRGGDLRAQAAAGHSLTLGYLLAMGFALWLGLSRREPSGWKVVVVSLWLWAGLAAALSRGPWVVAAATYLVYYLVAPVSMSAVASRLLFIVVASAAVLISPVGPSIIDRLPFIGTVDADNVSYRQQLASMSWQLIKQNPLFGSPFVLTQLESLRQGQGIIDLVNSYAAIAMFYGGVGLLLFIGSFLYGFVRTYARARRLGDRDPQAAHLGAALVAAMFGTLLMLGIGSFGNGLAVLYWGLAGMAVAYAAPALPVRTRVPAAREHRLRPAPRAI